MRRFLLTATLVSMVVVGWMDLASAGLFHRRTRCCCSAVYQSTQPTPQPTMEVFTSPKGHTYRSYLSEIVPPSDEDEVAKPLANRAFEWRAGGDDYIGHDRKVAKTSIATAPLESPADLKELLGSLPSDEFMMHEHDPILKEDEDFDRVQEEERNVRVEAWVYAAKKETNDNDFHLLVGNGPSEKSGKNMMNMEITGLPRNEFRAQLKQPRDDFKAFLGGKEPPTSTYKVFPDPIHVRVTGSLFYDIDHPPGKVGTNPYKPHTAWEVHPVTKIEFLDE